LPCGRSFREALRQAANRGYSAPGLSPPCASEVRGPSSRSRTGTLRRAVKRAQNPDADREYHRGWRAAHPDLVSKYSHAAYLKSTDKWNQRSRERYKNNRDEILAKGKTWRQAHPELLAARARKNYLANKGKVNQRAKEWKKKNPAKVKAMLVAREVLRRNGTGVCTAADLRAKKTKQKGRCFYCQAPLKGYGSVDHYIPIALGGTHDPQNIVLACLPCNWRKNKLPPEVFIRRLKAGMYPELLNQ
jgi:5-methylcytosine-specific restriction endonuclease McrA